MFYIFLFDRILAYIFAKRFHNLAAPTELRDDPDQFGWEVGTESMDLHLTNDFDLRRSISLIKYVHRTHMSLVPVDVQEDHVGSTRIAHNDES